MNKDQIKKDRWFQTCDCGNVESRGAPCYNNVSESALEEMFGKSSDLKNAQCRSSSNQIKKDRCFQTCDCDTLHSRAAPCYNNVSESALEKMFGKSSDLKNAQCRSSSHEMNLNDGTVHKHKYFFNTRTSPNKNLR